MVKKILFLFIFIFLFDISNVFAYQLPTAYTGVDYVDGTYQDGNTNVASWWGSNNYLASPYRIGYFTSATAEAEKVQFLWSNLNLCPNQNLKISGKIGALFNFFTENPYTISVFNNNQEMTCSFSLDESSRISYTCVGVGGGNFYLALTQLNFSSHNNYEVGVSRDVDYSCEVTNLQVMEQDIINTQNIINSQNSNTNQIIQDNQQNTQDIIDNQSQNTQDIIDNQNSNTESTNKTIEEQFNNCRDSVNLFDKSTEIVGKLIVVPSGVIQDNPVWTISDFIPINPSSDITLSYGTIGNGQIEIVQYDENHNLVGSLAEYITNNNKKTIRTLSSTRFVRIGFRNDLIHDDIQLEYGTTRTTYEPYGEVCSNRLDEQTNAINGLNDSITSDTPPDTENEISNLESDLISDTPITDLITLPITLLNSYINGFNGSCSPYNLGNLYGTDLILPCLNLQQRLGSNLWTIIDSLFSIFMIYNIAMLMIQAFEGFTSLRDDYEGLYQPRHSDLGYQPKHGGGN